jgi:hypothetical protein
MNIKKRKRRSGFPYFFFAAGFFAVVFFAVVFLAAGFLAAGFLDILSFKSLFC